VLETVGLWTGCVVGALEKGEYEGLLAEAGFEDVALKAVGGQIHEVDLERGVDRVRQLRFEQQLPDRPQPVRN